MYETNVNLEVENELIENLAIEGLHSLMVATLEGIAPNRKERTAYTAGFLAAISIFTDTATSIKVMKKMSGEE